MKTKEAEQLLKVSLQSEKNERMRIAADLHDSVSSDLSAIRNYLALILNSEKDKERIILFQDLKEGVEVAIENTRQVSYKLMPPLLDKFGFEVALKDYFNKLSVKTALSFTVVSNQKSNDFDSNVSFELFRIVQEFTTNMLKYGAIKNCQIALYVINAVSYIEIIDDGKPYNFEKLILSSSGTGLKNISSRLRIINAKIIQKEAEVGNHFVISFSI
jgi:signal transduction histidine kinase